MPTLKPRPPKSASRGGYSAPALEKGVDILELLAAADTGLTVSEISQRLKRNMSELFRIIVVLERRGWLRKDPESARYFVSYHVLKIAHRGTPAQTLTQAASLVMQDLSTTINQSCHLVVRADTQGLVILRQENQKRHANLSVRLGAVVPLVGSCSGHVLLAHLDDQERQAVLRELPRSWEVSRTKLTQALNRIRKRGFEVQRSPVTAGVTDISYPVRGFDGRVMAALTVPYLHALDGSLPTTVEETRGLIEHAARRISQALGAPR